MTYGLGSKLYVTKLYKKFYVNLRTKDVGESITIGHYNNPRLFRKNNYSSEKPPPCQGGILCDLTV
jgi:hypothetical protein